MTSWATWMLWCGGGNQGRPSWIQLWNFHLNISSIKCVGNILLITKLFHIDKKTLSFTWTSKFYLQLQHKLNFDIEFIAQQFTGHFDSLFYMFIYILTLLFCAHKSFYSNHCHFLLLSHCNEINFTTKKMKKVQTQGKFHLRRKFFLIFKVSCSLCSYMMRIYSCSIFFCECNFHKSHHTLLSCLFGTNSLLILALWQYLVWNHKRKHALSTNKLCKTSNRTLSPSSASRNCFFFINTIQHTHILHESVDFFSYDDLRLLLLNN